MQILDMLAEQRILEAIERGEFDDLPGRGRPLDLDEDLTVPEELRVAYRLLKNAGFLPREVEMRREIHDVRVLIRAGAGETRGSAERRLQYLLMCLETLRGGEGLPAAAEAYLSQVRVRLGRDAPAREPTEVAEPAPARGPHRIEVRVRNIGQLFNSMDPSPFIEKELDAEAEEFIVGWAKELPPEADVTLAFHVVELQDAASTQALLAEAMRNFFEYKLQWTRRRLGLLTRNGWRDLGRGLLFLAGSIVVANLLEPYAGNPSWAIIKESVIIGGWVAMWRPMEIFLYERWPLQRLCALYGKLARAPVNVVQAS